jgi:hypothetical protein
MENNLQTVIQKLSDIKYDSVYSIEMHTHNSKEMYLIKTKLLINDTNTE